MATEHLFDAVFEGRSLPGLPLENAIAALANLSREGLCPYKCRSRSLDGAACSSYQQLIEGRRNVFTGKLCCAARRRPY